MNGIWDSKSDAIKKGDNLRDVSQLMDKTRKDGEGFIHYVFSKANFSNQWYTIPEDDFKLFENFIEGGSRAYPSDGSIPCDIIAKEARKVLKKIELCSQDPNHHYCQEAREVLKKGKLSSVRGTLKLYLGKYTTRDWRRKRFTDDIDFWVYKFDMLEYVLRMNGWVKNKNTREWEKKVLWDNPMTLKKEEHVLIASNDINQALDFGAGKYLEGTRLKDIFKKKIKRGHDVDLSDIINVAMVLNKSEGFAIDEWYNSWEAFEESANTRNTRSISSMISLTRYSAGIADHLERLSNVLIKLHDLIFDKILNPDDKIFKFTRVSIHWQKSVSYTHLTLPTILLV